MPIIAIILLTLGFWVFYWFVRMGGIDHFQAKFAHRKEEERRAKARALERTVALRAVDDPRDAATTLMVLIARGGDPTNEQIATIETTLRTAFGFEQELTERMTQARFVASSAESFDQAGRILSDMLKKRLTAKEKHQLITMLEEVARLDGPSRTQSEAIAAFRQRIDLAARPDERR